MSTEPTAKNHPACRHLLRRTWSWLRQVTGDAAYENYVCSMLRASGCEERALPPRLSRAEFYLDALERRYSTTSRCC
jgi:uncharacterized short protein YbdD (DUF466 family)